MFNVGPVELIVILVLALIVFGPEKLPELMASAGRAIREFQRASSELTSVFQETQQEFSSALDVNEIVNSTVAAATEAETPPSTSEEVPTDSAPDPPASDGELTQTVPVAAAVSARAVPVEYETAAAMLDPIKPYEPPLIPFTPTLAAESAPTTSISAGGAMPEPPAAVADAPGVESQASADVADAAVLEAPVPAKPRRTRRKSAAVAAAEPSAEAAS